MNKLKSMYLKTPAFDWKDAVPLGNGQLGALVYGNVKNELITFNHENLFLPSENPELHDVSDALPGIRQRIAEKKYAEAEKYLREQHKKLIDGTYRLAPYQPLMDLCITFSDKGEFFDYTRSLDFETGICRVSYTIGGVKYTRESFVDLHSNLFLMKISSSSGEKMSADVLLGAKGSVNKKGIVPYGRKKYDIEFTHTTQVCGNRAEFTACYPGGERFGGKAVIFADGAISQGTVTQPDWNCENPERMLSVGAFTQAVIAVSGYAGIDDMPEIPENLDYEAIKKAHCEAFRALFNRVELNVETDAEDASNENLLLDAKSGTVSPLLPLKMFSYGRYLLISSSYHCSKPANLQGIWNGDYAPCWDSDFHNDENIQMNYWAALPGNLEETVRPYLDYYFSMIDDYRENARKVYGMRGLLIPICQTTNGRMHSASIWSSWVGGAGWLAQLFYDYYLYTGDKKYLEEKVLVFLEETANFYADYFTPDETGTYRVSPSLSPENVPANSDSMLSVNATMDVAIAREVLGNLVHCYEILGRSGGEKWKAMLEKMPSYRINADGAIQEWICDDLQDNYHHRHISHLYPLFPGNEVTRETDPELFEAIRVAAQKRLVVGMSSQTGWSYAHQANVHARLEDGAMAYKSLERLVRSSVGKNLFCYHNDIFCNGLTLFWGFEREVPFQIDANFGLTAAVLEMLVFSNEKVLKILPALPPAWRKGSITNVRCRGNYTVSVRWDLDRELCEAEVVGKKNNAKIVSPYPFVKVNYKD